MSSTMDMFKAFLAVAGFFAAIAAMPLLSSLLNFIFKHLGTILKVAFVGAWVVALFCWLGFLPVFVLGGLCLIVIMAA